MKRVRFETRVKMVEVFEKALMEYHKTGNAKVLDEAQREMVRTYREELRELPERVANRIARNIANEDMQIVANKAQRIKLK